MIYLYEMSIGKYIEIRKQIRGCQGIEGSREGADK